MKTIVIYQEQLAEINIQLAELEEQKIRLETQINKKKLESLLGDSIFTHWFSVYNESTDETCEFFCVDARVNEDDSITFQIIRKYKNNSNGITFNLEQFSDSAENFHNSCNILRTTGPEREYLSNLFGCSSN